MARLDIDPARTSQELELAKLLVGEYAASLGFDLGYQDFAAELADFPGKYAPPSGALLVGRLDGAVMGMVALRDLGQGYAEMKRLYVRPAARGSGLGAALAAAIVESGRFLGYRALRLDTVAGEHDHAIALYRRLGFYEIPAYYESPIPGTLYFQFDYR